MARFNFGFDLYEFDAVAHRQLLIRHGIARITQGELTKVMCKTKKGLIQFLCEYDYDCGAQYPNEADIAEMKTEIYKLS